MRFDRSALPPCDLEFVAVADTHHIVDPGMYSSKGDSVTPEITRDWSSEGTWLWPMCRRSLPS